MSTRQIAIYTLVTKCRISITDILRNIMTQQKPKGTPKQKRAHLLIIIYINIIGSNQRYILEIHHSHQESATSRLENLRVIIANLLKVINNKKYSYA